MSENRQAQLVAWLEDQGHSPAEIEKILDKVAEYDERMTHDSIFDSIGAGNLDLSKLIEEALASDEASAGEL